MFNVNAFTAIKTESVTCEGCRYGRDYCACRTITWFRGGRLVTLQDGTTRYHAHGVEVQGPVYQAPEQDFTAALMALWVK